MRRRRRKTPDMTESTAARIRAEHDLERHLAESYRISKLVEEWRHIRERNNIAAAFEASIRGRKP
jgi:hypothetical protein